MRQVVSSNTTQNTNSTQQKNQMKKNAKQNNIKKFSSKSAEYWPQIVNDLKQSGKIVLYTNLMNTKATELNDMTVGIEFPNGMTSFGKTVLEKPENVREISNLVSMACGKEMQIKYIPTNNTVHHLTKEEDLQKFANESDIPFNIIE
jgi:DNA polymerase-3 subunit gamma/tau